MPRQRMQQLQASQINANGVTATYTYDQLNRLTDLVHTDSLNNEIASYAYELGSNGNRLSLTEGTGRVVEYDYDDLYRLLSETVTDPINGNHFSQWSYDPVGNRLQQDIDGVVTVYNYNDNDHLLTETTSRHRDGTPGGVHVEIEHTIGGRQLPCCRHPQLVNQLDRSN